MAADLGSVHIPVYAKLNDQEIEVGRVEVPITIDRLEWHGDTAVASIHIGGIATGVGDE